jgi:hypothetical protein
MWYYAADGKQHGPMDDAALNQLTASGTIGDATLVWKEGLPEWISLQQARTITREGRILTVEESASCSMCGKAVGADNLIELAGLRVCGACKSTAVQALREGATAAFKNAAWRDGRKVMTHNKQSLPPRCYKCNAPVSGPPLKRKLYWHPPGYYLLIFVQIFIYIIVAIIVRKQASVELYLCAHHVRRRRYFIAGGWGGSVLAIGIISAGIMEQIGALTAVGFIILAAAIGAGLFGAALTRATRIQGDTVWLIGSGKEFLASLPPWP